MEPRDQIVLTAPGAADAAIAIAAIRAGARGVLDLEFTSDTPATRDSISRFTRFGAGRFAFKLGLDSSALLEQLPQQLDLIILGGNQIPALAQLRRLGCDLFIEAVSVAEAIQAAEAGADGIILKGHEAGGRVGADTSFILIQKWRQYADRQGLELPFWVRGGVGPHAAAAARVSGARGVVLDSQVLLTRESPLSAEVRRRLAGLDGSETQVLGAKLGEAYRIYARPDSPSFQDCVGIESQLLASSVSAEQKLTAWRQAVRERVSDDPATGLWLVGQDIALAPSLASKGVTTAGVIQAIKEKSSKLMEIAHKARHLTPNAPLAKSHGTKFPILQGPMTRVSDTASFADAVATGGGLPFLALALLRKAETESLLADTKTKLGKKPWGVGILGFVPNEIRAEQLAAIEKHKPPYAIIAGGRPDQAKELEAHGIPTYLHVPSPGLLRMYLKDGARRFIFEGQECGGHIGPRTSFALWEAMLDVLNEHLAGGKPAEDLHIVFAGGIHDGLSAAMVAALSAGLAEKNVKVGVLLGTAYLFTTEAVTAGAITARFQQEALGCGETVLLETGPGHAIRCIPTPYAETFEAEKQKLKVEGKSPLNVGMSLERMNLGRLRVASKGVDRASGSSNGTGLHTVAEDEQYARGMYMIGQVAALRDSVTTIAQLHRDVSESSTRPIGTAASAILLPPEPEAPPPCDVAVIGLSCFYPKGSGLWPYWENILAKVNGVVEIPSTHWDWRLYYDPDPRARDKIISKWGGFMDDVAFDPLKYGITPKSIPNIEPLQLLLLEAVNQAIGDAGYLERPFDRERTCAILGVGGGGMPLSVSYGFRSCMPLMDTIPGVPVTSSQILELGQGILPEWTEDSFPGILLNVAAGRVANRFNLGGPNMAIDAACGSSLAALYAGVRELNTGTSDVAVVMGADAVQTPYAYVAFSKTHALSPRGRCRPFDAEADGIALAEGIGVMVLKRLADAERDGDRIYAVIKGVGSSSDGRDKGLTAPRAEGQLRALHRAYAQARVSPARVGLVEAHGTGTVVGDQTEAKAIGQLMRDAGGLPQSCAIGSVKSMIGHSKCAAGLAGLIKATFALHYKVLPPTLAETPNPKANLDGGPLFLNTEARPWVHGAEHPRTAGVSAFGFGGTNFHAVLEEYRGDFLNRPETGLRHWPAELFVWRRPDKGTVLSSVKQVRDAISAGATPEPGELAASLWQSSKGGGAQSTLAVVASSITDLKDKLDIALDSLPKTNGHHADPRGIYFAEKPEQHGKVAFLFPGQGSQYPDMLAQAAMAFSEVRESIDLAERVLTEDLEKPLGKFIYPPSPFSPDQEAHHRKELQCTEIAQPAVGAVSIGMFRLLVSLGVIPDFLAGHSYGEYAALAAAGAMSEEDLIRISYRRGRAVKDAATSGGMAAVEGSPAEIEPVLNGLADVWLANQNAPSQTVLAGTEAGLKAAGEKLHAAGIRSQRIPVACGFHSPLIAGAKAPLTEALAEVKFDTPRQPVFSNTTATPHVGNGAAIARQLAEHLVSPVRFADELRAMYEAGARVFVEVGPQAVLTGLATQTLSGKPHLALASDVKSRPGLVQLGHLLGQLLTAGIPANLDRLFAGRGMKPFDLARFGPDTGKIQHTPTTWIVNGVRSRPLNGPEPRLLGQTTHKPEPAKPVIVEPKPEPPARVNGTASPPVPTTVPASRVTAPPVAKTPRAPMNNTNEAPPVPVVSANGQHSPTQLPAGAAEVMSRFQDVMARFLDTQRSVMLSYLGGGGAPTANGHTVFLNGNGHANGQIIPPPAVGNRYPAMEPPAPRQTTVSPPPRETTVSTEAPAGSNGKHTTTPASAPTEAKATSGGMDRESLLAKLLDLVSERTGYPKDALSIDLDLEADLGIDSIKRVEILGALAEGLDSGSDGQQPKLEMEKLSVIKTLRGIADYVAAAIADAEPTPQPSLNGTHAKAPSANGELHPGARKGEVQRLVVRPLETPLPLRPTFAQPAGTILITDDGRGTAQELADRLADLDVSTVLLRLPSDKTPSEKGFVADLTDPAAVADLVARVHDKCGQVSGLIHLLPLAEPAEDETEDQRMRREVKSLYLLSRALEADIREAGKNGSAVLLAVTGMGGTMGYGGDLPDDFFAGHGGVAGFTKCLGYEWPEVTVRVVDVSTETPAPRLVEQLLAELGDPEGPFEVGRDGDRRITLQVEPGPLNTDDTPAIEIEIKSTSTILITGGARGITAKIAAELARRYQPNLVLIGSSPLPTEEPADTAGLTSVGELKSALMKRLGTDARPAAVESAYRRLLKDREIRANLDSIRAAGSTVDYRALDVRDTAALGGLIDELNAAGGITGVIHGAGVIEDKLLRDKTPESYDRVFGTKVESALTLARKLDPSSVQFFALFASITSRYGNRGQSDYAAANEVLSKLACDLDRKWPGRVVSIAWGPWAEVGMVADLEKHLVARGLKLITTEVGSKLAVDELVFGGKGEPEVLVAGGTEHAGKPQRQTTGQDATPVAVGAE